MRAGRCSGSCGGGGGRAGGVGSATGGGGGKSQVSVVRYRRAMVVLASAGGNTVEVIARLVQTSPDRVREMIHWFNEMGMASLDPRWAGGRPRLITTEDEEFIVKTAKQRPEKAGKPFSHWSLRKLRDHLGNNPLRKIKIGKERLRQILDKHEVNIQRTKTWKHSNDPAQGTKAGPHRGGADQVRGPSVRVRRVRAVGDPSDRR